MPHGRNVLIIEDNPHMQVLLTELLRGMRVQQIKAVATLAAAREVISESPCDFALVDIGLAGENGLDFVKEIRLNKGSPHRHLPMIVISGQGSRQMIEAARDSGADAFLIKPISNAALTTKINSVLDRFEIYVESPTYYGPDRRRGADPRYTGVDRRRAYLI